MPISRGDRFKLVCYLGKIHEFKNFKTAFWKQLPKGRDISEKALHRAFERWKEGGGFHEHNERFFLAAAQANGWPAEIPGPAILLDLEETVPRYLETCKLSYEEVESLLSPEARAEWTAARHNLHFMKALDEQSRLPKAKVLLPNLVGTYRLYRRHSMLPGLLREHFTVEKAKDGNCEGIYIQYARAHPPNIIPFNAFFCEFYVIAFGAHQAVGRRTEIVTVSVLVENAFSGNAIIPCDHDNKFFIGLLTGIYDFGNVLLAERVLIEKLNSSALIERTVTHDGEVKARLGKWGPIHIHQTSDGELRGEYRRVSDVIDNSLDGQTLAARWDRLELLLRG